MKAVVVGLGRMGRFHVRALRDLGLDVVTVDPDPNAGADHARAPFGSFDVACIAAPINHLAEHAAAWSRRVPQMLVEKPFAASLAEARELEDLLDCEGTGVAVGYVERFNPLIRTLARALEGCEIFAATFTRHNTRPVDGPLDLVAHDVDLARHLGLADIARCRFDALGGMPETVRTIAVERRVKGELLTVDLTDHDTSPLHAQWHAILSRGGRPATPRDAVAVLEFANDHLARPDVPEAAA